MVSDDVVEIGGTWLSPAHSEALRLAKECLWDADIPQMGSLLEWKWDPFFDGKSRLVKYYFLARYSFGWETIDGPFWTIDGGGGVGVEWKTQNGKTKIENFKYSR